MAASSHDYMIRFFFHRGRYSVELHLSFLRLQGQANDFKIQYSSVVRLFLLQKVIIFRHISGHFTYISSHQIRGIIMVRSLNRIPTNGTLVSG